MERRQEEMRFLKVCREFDDVVSISIIVIFVIQALHTHN